MQVTQASLPHLLAFIYWKPSQAWWVMQWSNVRPLHSVAAVGGPKHAWLVLNSIWMWSTKVHGRSQPWQQWVETSLIHHLGSLLEATILWKLLLTASNKEECNVYVEDMESDGKFVRRKFSLTWKMCELFKLFVSCANGFCLPKLKVKSYFKAKYVLCRESLY